MTDEEMIAKWRELIYDKYKDDEYLEESDWEGLAMGLFIAFGATPEHAWKIYQKCIKLGCF